MSKAERGGIWCGKRSVIQFGMDGKMKGTPRINPKRITRNTPWTIRIQDSDLAFRLEKIRGPSLDHSPLKARAVYTTPAPAYIPLEKYCSGSTSSWPANSGAPLMNQLIATIG
jgi:hypothetical protein